MIIYYAIPEMIPDSRARFIQSMNTCRALAANGAKVALMTGMKKGETAESVLKFYGLSGHANLEIVNLPMLRREQGRLRISWHGVFHLSLWSFLWGRKRFADSRSFVYLRHLKLADFIIKRRKSIGLPVIYEAHELFHVTAENHGAKNKLRQQEERVFRRSDMIICTSNYLKEQVLELCPRAGGVHVAPNGIKEEWLSRADRSAPGDYILYAGSLYPWKGVDTLIKAAGRLPRERVLIVGGGGRLEALKDLADKEGVGDRVEFAGKVPHEAMPEYFSRARAAVLPNIPDASSRFSLPIKLFEYMGRGLPVAAADLPAVREVIRDGENGLLFEPGNPEALAECIKRLGAEPGLAARLSENARTTAREFTYDKRAQKIIGLLNPAGDR